MKYLILFSKLHNWRGICVVYTEFGDTGIASSLKALHLGDWFAMECSERLTGDLRYRPYLANIPFAYKETVMKTMKKAVLSGLFGCMAAIASTANAGIVADRTSLNTLLGASAVTEDFNLLTNAAAGGQGSLDGVLNNSTNVSGLGTGRVISGVEFSRVGALNFPNDLYMPQSGYFGFANPALLSGSSQLQIDFTTATGAFGLDLLEYLGYSDRVSFAVYGADDTTLLSTEEFFSISSPTSGVFFGFSDAAGIGRVVATGINTWSPIVDNLTFGQANGTIPTPATLPLLALGLAGLAIARRRT